MYTADVCIDVHKYIWEKSMAFRGADQKSVTVGKPRQRN